MRQVIVYITDNPVRGIEAVIQCPKNDTASEKENFAADGIFQQIADALTPFAAGISSCRIGEEGDLDKMRTEAYIDADIRKAGKKK